MLEDFIKNFTTRQILYEKINTRFYLKNKRLSTYKILHNSPVLFGLYLGEMKNDTFHPSFNLLQIISDMTDEKIMVNDRGEIDFLYGKNLRKRHIISINGSQEPDRLKLVQNKNDENLGYGLFIGVSEKRVQVLKHILDRGVFIKRDKQNE